MTKKILLSAYACEPNKGSEPAVGWNFAIAYSKFSEVWVLTRENNRKSIENAMKKKPISNLHFIYFDLPGWVKWWKIGQFGIHLYYYLWQLFVFFPAKKLNNVIRFDLVHHVTFACYYKPSLLYKLDIPFIWGPVGGGESAPFPFWLSFGFKGFFFELIRSIFRKVAELDPLVKNTARYATLSLASSPETAKKLTRLRCKNIQVFSQVQFSEFQHSIIKNSSFPSSGNFRFISIGRLLHWKGFNLGIQAFASANLIDSEYWIIGDGPDRKRLENSVKKYGLEAKVKFFGSVSHDEVFRLLGNCHALVHPSLHESGGWVIVESLLMGRPVICFDLGGPSLNVNDDFGVKISAKSFQNAIDEFSSAMIFIRGSIDLYKNIPRLCDLSLSEKLENLVNSINHETK
jgi:glycosyltransferase involved in cell wall biosynthesis